MIPPTLLDVPYGQAFLICLGFIAATYLLSIITREYSWVDRIWSVAPVVYALVIAAGANFGDPRLNLMAALVTAWGARLTFNFWRRGGYAAGGEDYRWAVMRARLGPVGFQLFNATFISPAQNLIIFALVAPMHEAWLARGTLLTWLDVLAAVTFIALLVLETVADQQQWAFHRAKHARQQRGEAVDQPFCTNGLFRYSRHPNYFAEISLWWAFYAFAVAASGALLSFTMVGAAVLTALFQGSTRLTEQISLGKYPSYAQYQRATSRIIPLPNRG